MTRGEDLRLTPGLGAPKEKVVPESRGAGHRVGFSSDQEWGLGQTSLSSDPGSPPL